MSEDLNDALKGLQPSDAGLDRGALLFEAGRASAPPAWRAWAVVGLLALTQTITLLALFAPPSPPAPPAPAPAAPAAPAPAEPRGPSAAPQRPPLLARELPEWKPAEGLVPDRPVLRPIDVDYGLFD